MKNKNSQAGFAPLLIIAIVAILAIGGGAYVVTKNKSSVEVPEERRGDIQYEDRVGADVKADAEANLSINAKGSLRSLLGLGKNVMCTYGGNGEDGTYSGTVYITSSGDMRGDFEARSYDGITNSHMIVKGSTAYSWSGNQGVKMNVKADASASAQAKSSVDLDSQVDYKCEDWTKDDSKFALPGSVNFLDIEAMMKGGVKLGQ
jgi:hypothetical protein